VSWLHSFRRKKISADLFARTLYEGLIQGRSGEKLAAESRIPPSIRARFTAKVAIYREAVLLMTLMSWAEKRAEFKKVLHSYEGIVFGAEATPCGLDNVAILKTGMHALAELIEGGGQGKELIWSIAWFRDIGHDEHNPLELALFAAAWMDEYIMVANTIEDCLQEFDVA
jgi:hypothetical protein